MPEWLNIAIAEYASIPWVQGIIIALATFILEDPTTIGAGLLVAEGAINWQTALFGLWLGIALGDIGLYFIGRFFGDKVVSWGWVSQERIDKATEWFNRNIVSAIVVSRFIPGLRMPTYVAAGIAKASALKFLFTAIGATLIWTVTLLILTVQFGELVLPALGETRWYVLIALLLLIILVNMIIHRRAKSMSNEKPVASSFEFTHPALFYIPVAFYYLWLGLRYWGLTLPTASNTSIYSGGMIGESKSQILSLFQSQQQKWVSPWCVLSEEDTSDSADKILDRAQALLDQHGLALPIVAKPDMGQRGDGVRPILSIEELKLYLQEFPRGKKLVLQELIPYENEAGVLYVRFPDQEKGTIFSITLKEFPVVVGDGKSTLKELILANERTRIQKKLFFQRHRNQIDRVLEDGETFSLVFSGNHCQGTIFKDGTDLKTDALIDRIDEISQDIPGFYYGRYDIRFRDMESFLQGKNFKIIELNGAGAEATHIWDSSKKLSEAYRILFKQYKMLFEIGAQNRKKGHKPLGTIRFLKDFFAYQKQAECYPETK